MRPCDDRLQDDSSDATGEEARAGLQRRRRVARGARAAVLRLQQVHVAAAGHVETMAAGARPGAIVRKQRQVAVSNRTGKWRWQTVHRKTATTCYDSLWIMRGLKGIPIG